jgi:hypothetical protein
MAIFFPHRSPPKEAQVIRNFYAHRAAFEQLRDMLIEDKKLVRVSGWGAQTTAYMATREHPTGDFPVDRYKQYLVLLKEVGGLGAHRHPHDRPIDVCIWVYASGWAADTRHLDLCWESEVPTNQVASLDDFYKTPKPRKPAFRRVESDCISGRIGKQVRSDLAQAELRSSHAVLLRGQSGSAMTSRGTWPHRPCRFSRRGLGYAQHHR